MDMDNGIGIYIHIPFCKAKCYYCDFHSYSGREHLAGPYFDALFSEMTCRAETIRHRPVRTVFIGGGTPSLVDPGYIGSVLELCSKLFKLEHDAEISLESNPGTLSPESLKAYRAAGVNRLSIGLQAWQDRLLQDLGRIHRRRQFVENLEAACQAGFRNINADLIFGLPNQSFEDWAETLEAVTGQGSPSGITHLSCYSLKIEEGTHFGDRYEAGTLKPADDELDRRMYAHAVQTLSGKGYRHYEISNFAKPGFECRHNLIYWNAEEYAGFGSGAHSYLDGRRFGNIPKIEEYVEAVRRINQDGAEKLHQEVQLIDTQEAMAEFMILGLRLVDGIAEADFSARFGMDLLSVYGRELEKSMREGLLEKICDPGRCGDGNIKSGTNEGNTPCVRYKLTQRGLDLANRVFALFIQ